MSKLVKATVGNRPVLLSINPTVAMKLAKKGSFAAQLTRQETIAFKLPGDHFGVEVLEGSMNYAECHSWYFNVTPRSVGNDMVEAYLSWVCEVHGKVTLGLTEVFYYTPKELDSVII